MSRHPTPAGGHEAEGPPAIHLPPPSYWPLVLAVGIALALAGMVLSVAVVAVGLVIMVVAIVAWVRDARREFDALH
jgi:cytochrome c oxidase subunit 1